MDPITFAATLPKPIQDLLLSMAGHILDGLLDMAAYQARRRFQAEPQQKALQSAIVQALSATVATISDDLNEQQHFLTLLGTWLGREAVLGELAQIIDPRPATTLDLDLLTDEFAAAGFDPDLLGEDRDFADVVSTLVRTFYDAAAAQPALQGQIEIGLLRGIAEAVTQQAAENRKQTQHLDSISDTLSRLAPLNLNDLERAYLRGVYADCTHVPLAGDAPVDVPDKRPRLQRIYVDLDTKTDPTFDQVFDRLKTPVRDRPTLLARWQKVTRPERMAPGEGLTVPALAAWLAEVDRRDEKAPAKAAKTLGMDLDTLTQAIAPLSALDVLAAHPQSVLLGDPGSGKSTLTRRLAGNLAAGGLETQDPVEQAWAAQLQTHFGRWLLPIRVVLSSWALHLAPDAQGCSEDLVAECVRILAKTAKLEGPRQKEHFLARLTAKTPTALLLLDGLDEVADPAKRRVLLAAVRDFCKAYTGVPLVVTCRIRPYKEGKDYTLPLPVFTLAPLTRPAMNTFVERWHAELTWAGFYTPEAASVARNRLLSALDDPRRNELREMAETPLLLTMMARVNYGKGLPAGRAELYEEYVKQLLYEWERRKLDDQGQPTRLDEILKEGRVSRTSLDRALNQLAFKIHGQSGDRDTVDISTHAMRDALEAIHPGEADEKAAWAVRMLRLIDDRSGLIYAAEQGTIYRFSHRTFQEYLAARWLATGDFFPKFKEKIDMEQWREAIFLALGYQISLQGGYDNVLTVFDELMPPTPQDESSWRRILLLGEAYVGLLGPQRAGEAEQTGRAQRVIRTMPECMTAAMQAISLPAAARLDAGLLLSDLGQDPPGLDDFVPLPANKSLAYPIQIGRYPVTNTQFRRFVDAGGYAEDRPWWTPEAVKEMEMWGDWRSGPRYWTDDRLNHATQPVVGISWYEAVAYCAWLTQALRQAGTIPPDAEVRLPTQAEWERAARSTHGQDYPWGGDFDSAKVNTQESKLNRTTPVNMYPDGATPEGVWDLAGNGWEWSQDDRSSGKALTGGSYYRDAQGVGASARFDWDPWFRLDGVGFRVVLVVPSSHGGFGSGF
ncbi:MAG: SUMF1/EgtB/PvdO family nonheme iron enzyme [Chromatiaceae bacterium]|nr:SUMF1/EgtB/PvdO family nonheme iron enzyme [Chromatiaceae bacterium]